MPDYRVIADSEVQPDAPVTSSLGFALRDNPIAIAEGAVGAPRIRTAGAFDGDAPAAGGGVIVVPSFAMGVASGFNPFADSNGGPLEENFSFMTVGSGSLRLQSGTVSVSGSGALEVIFNGSSVASVGNGQSLNIVVNYSTNQVIRFRAWKSVVPNSVSAPNIQIRSTRTGICVLPFKWGYGLP